MFKQVSVTFFLLLTAAFCLTAQRRDDPWRFALSVGPNSTILSHNIVIIGETSTHTDSERLGLQASGISQYSLSGRWKIQSGVGLTKVHSGGNRFNKALLGNSEYDTVHLNYLSLDIPLTFRFQVKSDREQWEGGNFFIDVGFQFKTLLFNRSAFIRHEEGISLFGVPSSYTYSGTLRTAAVSPSVGLGSYLGHFYTLSLNWSWVALAGRGRPEIQYWSRITSLSLQRFF